MPEEKKNYFTEDLIQNTESLMASLQKLDEITSALESSFDEETEREIEKGEMESIERSLGLQSNGYAEIKLSADRMLCFADFYPPTLEGTPLSLADVEALVFQKNLVIGVDWESIKNAVCTCNEERREVLDVCIARGEKPVNEIPVHIKIEDSFLKQKKSPDRNAQKIDYREINPFKLVRKGEKIAEIIPERKGRNGYTVTGEEIPFGKESVVELKPGANTARNGNAVVAACDGTFEMKGNDFWVNEVLEIQGDVNYHTGNINFPGDVIIKGVVEDGFKVCSGNSIFCRKTLYATDIRCCKDLIINQGIIGRKRGRVKVGGRVRVKFIENCYLEAGEDIEVQVGILNSVVHSLGRIKTLEKGLIVGGKLFAQKGIEAYQIGTASGTRTEIICGIDYSVLQKLEWIRDKNIELIYKLKNIEERIKKKSSSIEQLVDVRDKIKESLHKLNEAAQQLVVKMDKNDDAQVIVSGSLFPGTYIEICHVSWVAARELKHVRIFLNKEKGRVESASL